MSVFSKYLKEAKEPTNSASSFIQSELDILKRNLDHIEKQLPAEINQLVEEPLDGCRQYSKPILFT